MTHEEFTFLWSFDIFYDVVLRKPLKQIIEYSVICDDQALILHHRNNTQFVHNL